jgi:GNAT superfamily N-acetyltransferase/ABC-type thiamine transport system ATPase subunit
MPLVNACVEHPIAVSFRTQQVAGMFDLPDAEVSRESYAVEIPALDEPWSIGAIVGPSGSGKSTIAKAAFGSAVTSPLAWPAHHAVIEGFGDHPIQTVTRLLTSVGFSSPPAWLRPYHVLSNGERFRCDVAKAMLTDRPLVVCDEFTSLVDRTVAKVCSAAIAKAIRKQRVARRFVAVTCHYNILEWLEADWVLDMATGALTRGRLRRPPIELRVVRAPQAAWQWFARHHYLSGSLSRGATCYIAFWNDQPVAFCATIRALGRPNRKRVTRLVTLPDFQGLGIGTRLLEHIGERVLDAGEQFGITTSHPVMCDYLHASPRWICSRVRRSYRPSQQCFRHADVRDSYGRVVSSFDFLG